MIFVVFFFEIGLESVSTPSVCETPIQQCNDDVRVRVATHVHSHTFVGRNTELDAHRETHAEARTPEMLLFRMC